MHYLLRYADQKKLKIFRYVVLRRLVNESDSSFGQISWQVTSYLNEYVSTRLMFYNNGNPPYHTSQVIYIGGNQIYKSVFLNKLLSLKFDNCITYWTVLYVN